MRTTKTRRKALARWLANEDYDPTPDDMAELLDDLDEQLENVATIATAAGLPADASAEEVVARVKELARPHVFAVRVAVERDGRTIATTQFLEPRRPPSPSDSREIGDWPEKGSRTHIVLRGPCYLDTTLADNGLTMTIEPTAEEAGRA